MNSIKTTLALFLATLLMGNAQAQLPPCYPGFDHRQAINIFSDGSNDTYTEIQVAVIVNTQDLLTAGKVKYNGDDFRFKDSLGNNLSYWFDPADYNQISTPFWVKVPTLASGTTNTIYMYYGNPSAAGVANGEATFNLFDSFESAGVDAVKWNQFGPNTNIELAGGTCTFNQSASEPDALLVSNTSFSDTLTVEMNTITASNGIAAVGVVDVVNYNGYVTAYQNGQMRMMGVTGASPLISKLLLAPLVQSPVVPNPIGIWSFEWFSEARQNVSGPSGLLNAAELRSDYLTSFTNDKKIIIGVQNGLTGASNISGSLQIEWVRARKYSVVEPTATLSGAEEEYPNSVNLSTTGPYCSGEEFFVSSDDFAGATYLWKQNNVTIPYADSSITIAAASSSNQGSYSVAISMPGCPAVNESIQIDVAAPSVEGAISPIPTLCSGTNQDSLVLTGKNGDVLRWEMSNSVIGPWTPLADTTPSLPFENIVSTTFFRAVVKSGTCPEVTQAIPYEVVVNSPTIAGFVIGSNTVCAGGNGGVVNLVYENGDVLYWESSNDNFTTTTNIVNTATDLSYSNLTQTTQYRALVRSGVCDPFYSASVEIVVNAKPIPAFTSTTECKGFNTVFNSSGSTSADGAITNYSWNFGNGSGSISSDPSYIYPAAGFYNVSLTIETDRGCTGSIPLNVQVYPLPLVDFTQAAVCLGAPMNFSVTSIPVTSVTSYDWDFGDGIGTDNVATPSYSYSTAGSFDVELIIESTNGCIDSITKQVDITAPVDVSFICDSVCEGTPSSFINTSVSPGSTVQYSWYFGDGSVSPLANPSYTYSDTGTYIVALEAVIGTFPSTCTRVTQDTVVIFEVPQTNFTYTDVCQVDSSVFNSTTVFSEGQNNLTFLWDFDDASIGSTQDIKHKYLLPNTYSVELTASTASGCSSSISKLVSIYYMPTATFTFGNVCLGNPMNFANGSNITSGSLTYEWDFADGSFPSAVNQPVHLYSADNSYDVELIATSNNNCKDTVIQTITVHPLPVVGFIADPVCHFNTSMFDDTSSINTSNSPASLVSYSWDFGDGSSSTSADPSHNYLNDQTYNVILTVTSNKGCVSQLSQAVIVNPMPYPNFEVTDACVGAPVLFVNSTQLASGTTSYGWNFGDNNVSIATEPIHYYSVGGFYQVWLVATSGAGCVDSIPKYAEVFSLPLPNAGIDTSVSQGFPVGLEGYYSGAIGYNWTPIESLSNNTISNPDATPLETTTYYLEVTDAHGCQNVDSMVVNVIEDFKLFIYNVITPDGNGQNDTWKITNIETFEGADIYVYDRWGGEVLSVKGYQNDWEGVSGTDQLPDGTYYYVIKAIETDKVYKGSLTVLRNK